MLKKDVIKAFRKCTPSQEEEKLAEDTEEEEILEQDYRYTCIQAYKSTKDPIWLFKALMEGEEGEVVYIPEFQEEIIKFYNQYKAEYNMNIEACVDHGKTHLITCLNTHEKIQDFRHTTIYSSENASTAKSRVNKIYNYLLQYSKLANETILFDLEQASAFNIKGNINVDSSCHARNFLSAYTGAHVKLFVMDDVETHDTISQIGQIIEAFQTKSSRRKSATGKMLAINTPYSSDGLLTFLRKQQGWITLQIALPETLLDEDKLKILTEQIEALEIDTIKKDQILNHLYKKRLFKAINLLNVLKIEEELKNSLIGAIKNTLDFRFRKRIILDGEIIEEEILPQWDWKVKVSGEDILNLYLTAPKSYQLTYALNTSTGTGGGFFTYHNEANINQKELNMLMETEEYWEAFSYDMSSEKRAGTVIINAIITKLLVIILSMKTTTESIYAVEANIKKWSKCFHIVETNSWQETIVNSMTKDLDQEVKDNIIFHYTGANKHDLREGIVAMNGAFFEQKTLFLEDGEGIEELKSDLSQYNGIKTKAQQWDTIDCLWIMNKNKDTVRTKRRAKNFIRQHRPRFGHIKKIN